MMSLFWKYFNLSKGARPIHKNPVNDKSTTKAIKNPVRNKLARTKKKATKAKNKLVTNCKKLGQS